MRLKANRSYIYAGPIHPQPVPVLFPSRLARRKHSLRGIRKGCGGVSSRFPPPGRREARYDSIAFTRSLDRWNEDPHARAKPTAVALYGDIETRKDSHTGSVATWGPGVSQVQGNTRDRPTT